MYIYNLIQYLERKRKNNKKDMKANKPSNLQNVLFVFPLVLSIKYSLKVIRERETEGSNQHVAFVDMSVSGGMDLFLPFSISNALK